MLIKFVKLAITLLILALFYPIGYFVLNNDPAYHFTENSDHQKSGIGAYVINLERSKERYEYIKNNIEALKIPITRINAVDGNTLLQEEINSKVDLKNYKLFLNYAPKLGTIGCSLSHIKAWQSFLESDFEFAIIFEDDVSFEPSKVSFVLHELVQNKTLWDISNLETAHHGMPLAIKTFSNGQKLVIYLTEMSHAGAYVINRQAARKLLEKALPIKMPVDHYFTRSWEFNLKFTGIENPRLVGQTFGQSEIAKTQSLQQEKLPASDVFRHIMYKLQSYFIRFLYNFKVYILNFI